MHYEINPRHDASFNDKNIGITLKPPFANNFHWDRKEVFSSSVINKDMAFVIANP